MRYPKTEPRTMQNGGSFRFLRSAQILWSLVKCVCCGQITDYTGDRWGRRIFRNNKCSKLRTHKHTRAHDVSGTSLLLLLMWCMHTVRVVFSDATVVRAYKFVFKWYQTKIHGCKHNVTAIRVLRNSFVP